MKEQLEQSQQETQEKKAYTAPELTEHGNVSDLTLTSSSPIAGSDSGTSPTVYAS